MAASTVTGLSGKYEPLARFWHISESVGQDVGSKVVVQGGRTKDFSEKSRQQLTSVVEIFDPYSELWEQRQVTGDAPSPGVHSSASASLNHSLFSFGGRDESESFNTLHRLDTKTWRWCQLSPQNTEGAPMPKYGCGIIAFKESLGVFGGYGIPRGPTKPQSFLENTSYSSGKGWTNEFHVYETNQGVWSCPATTGERPPPCSSFTLTAVDDRRAVMFGGNSGKRSRMNDVYIIDFLTMHWTKLTKSGGGLWPEERSSHAACCLNYGQQFPQLLVTGGLNRRRKPLSDIWMLDVERGRWKKANVTLRPRYCHSLTASSLGPGLTVVTVFGGTAEPWSGSNESQPKLANTTLLQFKLVGSSGQCEWELVSVVDNTQRGSVERMVEKMRCMAELKLQPTAESEMTRMERQELEAERDRARAEKQAAEDRVREMEGRVREMEGEREGEREEKQAAEYRVREMEDAVREIEGRMSEIEGDRDDARAQKQASDERARAAETDRDITQREKQAVEERLMEIKSTIQAMEHELEKSRYEKNAMDDKLREMEGERDREREAKMVAEDRTGKMEGERNKAREDKKIAEDKIRHLESERDRVKLELQQIKVGVNELQQRLVKQRKHEVPQERETL